MPDTKVNSTLLKNVNRKKILAVIDKTDRISRVEIKDTLKKNGKTVTNIINSLIDDGLVMSVGFSHFTGGRRREVLSINPEYGYLLGIHLGIQRLSGIITDFKYKIIAEEKISVSSDESAESLIEKIKKILQFLINHNNIDKNKILKIGFVANGLYNNKTGEWILSVNNPNWKNIPIREILSKIYSVPVLLENNSRAMALWEKTFGNARNAKIFIYINLGIGISSVFFNNGRIYEGINNKAGELGHTVVVPNGQLCSCGNRGCLETVASGWAILGTIKEKVKNGAKTEILDLCNNNIEDLNIDMVFQALVNGDELAKEVFESASSYLGIAIANLINLYDPCLVVLGGNFAKMSRLFIEKLKEKIKKYVFPLSTEDVVIVSSSIQDNTALLGAITLVRDTYFHITEI
jgi:predicted NBD/HSP70 family sugar kinase